MLTRLLDLQTAVDHLNEIQRLARIGSWELDLLTNDLSWSEEIFRIFEIDPNEFSASYDGFLALVHPDDRNKVDHAYNQSVKQGTAYEITHRLLMPDGRIKYVRENGRTIYSDFGRPVRSLGTVQDMTEDAEQSAALRKTQEYLLQAENLARFGYFVLLRGQDKFHWSDSVYQILGKSKETFEPTFTNVQNLVHPDDRSPNEAHKVLSFEALVGRGIAPMTARFVKDDDSIITIESRYRPMTNGDGIIVGLFGTVQDITELASAERRSEENAKRFEMLEGSIPEGIWDWDIITGKTYVSPRWKNILGYGPDEHIDQQLNYFSYIHPEDLPQTEEAVRECLEVGAPFILEIRRLHRDGKYRWVRCRASAVLDSAGKAIRMLGTMSDITLEKESETARKALEHSLGLQSAIRESPVPIAMFDCDMQYMSASNRWREYLDCNGVDLVGSPFLEFAKTPPEDWRKAFSRALANGSSQINDCPWAYKGASAHLRWILRAWHDTQGEVGGVVAYIEDITSERLAETERSNREALFGWLEKITNSVPGVVGTFKRDPQGNYSFSQLSKSVREVFGIDPADLKSSADPVFSRISAEDQDRVRAEIEQSATKLSPWRDEFRYNHPQRGTIWIEGLANPEAMPDGGVIWHGFLQDVTERKELQLEALKKTELLYNAQKMELVGQLAAGIAHDFNNLLAVISGSMEFVDQWAHTGEVPDQKLVSAASNACARGKELVQRLLSFSRQVPIAPIHAAIDPLIIELLTILQRTLGETIDIETKLLAGDATALIDRSQFTSAILNLALNARDAMPKGGKLSIETWVEERATSKVQNASQSNSEGRIGIKVMDTGSGMSQHVRGHALQPGFTTKPPGLGAGLGLSLVASFVHQAGGAIEIESKIGLGTAATMYLPRSKPSLQLETNDPHGHIGHRTRRGKVLVVEDDLDVRAVVEAQLKKLNYDVLLASTGEEAINVIASPAEVSFLLTDIILRGGIDGIEVLKESLRVRPRLGVICMTGYATPERGIDLLRHQNIQLLEKPFGIEKLAEALDRVSIFDS